MAVGSNASWVVQVSLLHAEPGTLRVGGHVTADIALDYDPLSAEAMIDPRPLYARLRAEDPVHYMPQYDTWALASFSAVWQALSDTDHFSVRRGQTPLQILLDEPAANLTFPELDSPEHRFRRRVFTPHYTRESAQHEDATIRAIAHDVLDARLRDHDELDAFGDYAHVVAGRFAASKTGIPLGDADDLRRDISAAFRRDPGQRGTSEANQAAMIAVFTYLHGLVAECRADRAKATGLLATLLDADVNGEPLSDEQIASELHTLMVTGSDTTELAVAGTLYYLARHPEQRAEVLADPAQAGWAFAETLRFDHPTDILGRYVKDDVVLDGKDLSAGQGVLLLWGSANRDEAEFPDADRFDMHRRYGRSLIFGQGQHKCIGEHIGMRMGTVMLEVLLTSISMFEVDFDRAERRCGEFLKGFNKLPISVTPARSQI